jgi:nucleotide-binding universal stress UspA family protein
LDRWVASLLAGFLKGEAIPMGTLADTSDLVHLEAPRSQPRALPRDAHAIRRILVCVDRSPFSEACLRQAVAISRSLGSTMTILHVMEPPHEQFGLHASDVLGWELSRQEASAYLERLKQEGARASGRQVETRLEQGHPAERIAAVARELDADLIVLGSHGERGVAAWNLGSTALQVLAVARGSVFIARSNPAAPGSVSPKRILVPLDGSLRTESVLPIAVRIAKARNAELMLVFVVREPVPTAVLRAPEDLEAARELATRLEVSGNRYLEGLRDRLMHEGVSARTVVLRSTDEKQSLLELSQKEQSDLIVLSAHGSTCNSSLTYGSVTGHLLTHSSVPMLVLQDLRDSELHVQEDDRRAPPLRASYPPEVA